MGLVIAIVIFFPYTAKWRRNDKRRYSLEKSEKKYLHMCVLVKLL